MERDAILTEISTIRNTVKTMDDHTPKTRHLDHNSLLSDISKGKALKHTETVDKSAPVIEKDIKIKPSPQKIILQEIVKPRELKHAQTVDKSAPSIYVQEWGENESLLKNVDKRSVK